MKLFFRNGSSGKRFSKRKSVWLAKYFLIVSASLALVAPLLCNEKPLYVKYRNENLFPALSFRGYADVINPETNQSERLVYSMIDWKEMKKQKVLWCPIVFSPGKSDWANTDYKSPLGEQHFSENGNTISMPLRFRHWLGTTRTGADVLSGLIHGTRVSFTVGIFSMIIAGFIGVLLGAAAGFLGDHKISVSKTGLLFSVLLGSPLSYFYGIYLNRFSLYQIMNASFISAIAFLLFILIIMLIIFCAVYFAGKYFGKLVSINQKTTLPVDQFVSRCIEIFNSIPRIVLIITLSAIVHPSISTLVLIIGLTSWTEIARLVRAEMLRIRESEFIQSATASGIPTMRLIFRHALPNALAPALTAITFGVASAILIESALSFLGIGVPANIVTWGSLLNEGKQNFNAWWLVVFPGIAIFFTVTALNIFGEALNEELNPRNF